MFFFVVSPKFGTGEHREKKRELEAFSFFYLVLMSQIWYCSVKIWYW